MTEIASFFLKFSFLPTKKNLKSRNLEIKVRKELGIEQKLLTQKEVLDLEPNLQPVFDAGVIYESAMHARDPHGILKKIFKDVLKSSFVEFFFDKSGSRKLLKPFDITDNFHIIC